MLKCAIRYPQSANSWHLVTQRNMHSCSRYRKKSQQETATGRLKIWRLTSVKHITVTLTGNISGTYMLVSKFTKPGTDNQWDTDLGKFSIYNSVGFRNIVSATTTLETGKFTNSLSLNYRSGYQDAPATVRNLGTGKDESITLHVPSYTTFDWQGRYEYSKKVELRAGIKNLFNRVPPMSLQAAGGGQQAGYDARYTDSILRTIYVTGKYKF